jgi:hypothetical protein
MMMPGASSLHRGASSPPVASSGGVLPIDPQQHTAAAMAVDNPAAFFSAAEASRYYQNQMHQAYENAATQGNKNIPIFLYFHYGKIKYVLCTKKIVCFFNSLRKELLLLVNSF